MDLETMSNMEPWEWPEDAKETLLAVIDDEHAADEKRIMAIEMAGDFAVVDDDLVERLLDVVIDPEESDEIRCSAAIAFGPALEQGFTEEFIDPDDVPISEHVYDKVRETLRDLYHNEDLSKHVRRRVFEASIRAPEDWHADAIRTAYTSGDPDWKLTAVFCMEHLRGFEKEILESLNDPDPLVQYHAVSAAGGWEIKKAWPHVSRLIKAPDTEQELRVAAMEAAMFIDPHKAPDLMADLAFSDDPELREAAQYVISMTEAMIAAEEDVIDDDYDEDDEDEDEGEDEEKEGELEDDGGEDEEDEGFDDDHDK